MKNGLPSVSRGERRGERLARGLRAGSSAPRRRRRRSGHHVARRAARGAGRARTAAPGAGSRGPRRAGACGRARRRGRRRRRADGRCEIAGEVLEQEQRRLVGPVQVVEESTTGSRRGRCAGTRHAARTGGAARRRPRAAAGRQSRGSAGGLGDQRSRPLARRARARPQHGVGARADVLAERFDERQVRQRPTSPSYSGPISTCAPRTGRRRVNSSASRVLPIPGSPTSITSEPLPGERVLERRLELAHARRGARRSAPRGPPGRASAGPVSRRRGRVDRRARGCAAARRDHALRALAGRSAGILRQQRRISASSAGGTGVVPDGRDGRRVDVLGDHGHRVVAEEGRTARHHLVEHRAERIEVVRASSVRPSACSGGM